MFKKNQQIRLNNTLYLIENIDGANYLLKDLKNKTVNWYSKPMIKKSLSQIVANKPLKYNDLSVSLLENGFHTTIDIYDGLNHYSKNVNECTSNALSTFAKKFKYFNNLTPKTLLKEGFIKSSEQPLVEQFGGQLFYHGSHTKDITTFNGNVFWSTSVDFAEQYGPIIYQAQLDLGKCFDISLKQHLEWLLKQTGGKIEYKDDDYNDKYIFGVNDYKKIANNNWETVEKYLPIIKGSFNSCKIVEEGTVNYIVFNNTQIKLLKVFNRRLDETVVCEDYAKDKEQRLKAEALADTIIKTLHKKSTEIIPSKDYFVVNMTKEFIKTCPELKKTGRQFLILLGNETKNPFHALGNLSNDENSEASLIYLPVIPERLTSSQFFDYVYALRHKQVDKIKKECYDKNYSQESMINILRTYMYNEVRKELYKTPAAKGLFSYNDVLVHELTHLLDNIRYTPTYKSHAQDTTSDKGLNDYYNSSEEQNAYYQETVYRFKQYIKNLQQMNINLSSIKSFDDFLNVFKYKYAGNFSRLTDKNKRRFTKRVYQYWKNAIADKEDIINESATLETNKPITIIGYHGTTKDFDNFDKKFVKDGFYFATKQRLQSLAGYYAGKNGYIIKAKIHFEHPFVGTPSQFQDLEMYHYKEMMTKYDGIISVSDGTIPSSQSYYNYKTEKLEYENLNIGDIIEMVVWNPNQIEIIKKVKLKELNESVQNKSNDNFQKWFNGSKIIDKNGNPLVCYHCTNQNFDTFDKNKIGTAHDMGHYGKGFYFSLFPNHYYGKKCLKCYLNIKNPYFTQYMSNDSIKEFSQLNLIPNNLKPIIKKYNLLKNDFYKNANINVKNIETKYGKNKVYTISYKNKEFTTDESSNYLNSEINDIKSIAWNNLYGDIEYKIHNKLYSNINSEQYTNAIKKLGYDGIIVSLSNSNNIEKSLEIIAFEPNQIKSINNNGEWNPNSNNIYESFIKDYLGTPIVYYTTSDTEAEQMISTLLAKNPVRGLYDLKNNMYIFGNAFNLIHADLIEKLKLYGKGFTYLPILEKEIYQYLDKYCAMFKIIDENDYKSFSSSDGYKYAYIGKLKNNQYVIFRNNELAPSHYNAPDELKKMQKVPLFKNIQFKKYDIRGIFLKSKDQLPQKTINESIKQSNLNETTVYAGSGNDYEKPSLVAINSGEGNQAHGWGLYYAVNKEVAQSYAKHSSAKKSLSYQGKKIDMSSGFKIDGHQITEKNNPALFTIIAYSSINGIKSGIEQLQFFIDNNKEYIKNNPNGKYVKEKEKNILMLQNAIKLSKDLKEEKGVVHKVEIPDDEYFMNESKFYNGQSAYIKKCLKNVIEFLGGSVEELLNSEPSRIDGKRDGVDIYDYIKQLVAIKYSKSYNFNSAKYASIVMLKFGIKGIKYNGRQDGICYVLFNPNDAKVIDKQIVENDGNE